MNTPTVSILIPAYNVGPYLRQCLDSVVAQTYPATEVLVVDDGSTDDTPAIADSYAARHANLRVWHIPNGGVANARNRLLQEARGEYILYVDADDWVEPTMVAHLVDMARTHRLDIAMCSMDNGSSAPAPAADIKVWDNEACLHKFLRHRELNGMLWNKLVRREFTAGCTFDPEVSYGEDALFVWQFLPRVQRLGVSNSILYHHRLHEASLSSRHFGTGMLSGHKVWSAIVADTARLYPQLEGLARAAAAVADFWLLYHAALDAYPADALLTPLRRNVAAHLPLVRRHRLLAPHKRLVAHLLARAYTPTAPLLRLLKG